MSKETKSYIQQRIERERAKSPTYAAAFDEAWLSIQLADRRVKAGLTQAEVAEELGVHQSNIARLERRPFSVRAGTLLGYLRLLGVEWPLSFSAGEPVMAVRSPRGSYRKAKSEESQ